MKDKELDRILQATYQNTKACGKVFFPDRFHRPFDKAHDQIFDMLDNSDNPRQCILAPRGMGKTSISNLLVPSKEILFQDKNYIVPVSASATSAEEQSENLKDELMSNETINELFEVNKTSSFARNRWVIDVGGRRVCVQPRGAGQQVRGMNWKGYRPDLIIVDDIEDDESVQNEDRRKKLKEWFFGALSNTVDRGSDNWKIIVIGTLLHEDSLLMNLHDDPAWDSVVIELCDDNFVSNVPNLMNDQECRALAKSYRDSGEIDIFYREFRNIPISTEDASFRKEYFQYYEPKHEADLFSGEYKETFLIIDPAKTAKMQSADSALVCVTIDLKQRILVVRDVVSGKFHPDQLYDEMSAMIMRNNVTILGVEVTGINEFITYPIKNRLSQVAQNVEFVELHARGGVNEKGKVTRVKALIPFYRQGHVYHNPACTSGLEAQLLSFPRSKRWDIMDALGYSVELLEKGEMYMMAYEDNMDDPQEVEAEYNDLDYFDNVPTTDFRII